MQMIRITTQGNLIHTLNLLEDGTPDYMSYPPSANSINTRMALEAAFNAGDYEIFTPSEPEPEPEFTEEQRWVLFQKAIADSPEYEAWFNAVAAANLSVAVAIPVAAAQRQAEVVQDYLGKALELVPMPAEAAQALQQIINKYDIPISLV